ncbi:MAG: hypothetical protein V7L21_19945 [Nostoc sp.]|uniref:hypothetical protein n=1 Tax=Nostoc sp. TaxID=1180 RepID=UPI002FF63EFA|nr:hypothetical protein [Nostoc sp. NMS9]
MMESYFANKLELGIGHWANASASRREAVGAASPRVVLGIGYSRCPSKVLI